MLSVKSGIKLLGLSGTRRSGSLRALSSKKNELTSSVEPKEAVYVHPLSQIVLQYFQTDCHDWIMANKLDRSLSIHRDGSFLIEFPSASASSAEAEKDLKTSPVNKKQDIPRIWTSYDPMDKKHL